MADDNEAQGSGAYLQGNANAGDDFIGRDRHESKDAPRAGSGGAAVNIRFGDGDESRERRPKRIWNMDDLYLELTRQLQQTNDRMNEMRLAMARLESETAQLRELRIAFTKLEEQFEILRDDIVAFRGGENGVVIAKATLFAVVVLGLLASYGVWLLSNGVGG